MAKTTIQLTDETKSDLEDLKRVDGESFDSVVKLLIANYNNEGGTSGIDETEIARKIAENLSVEQDSEAVQELDYEMIGRQVAMQMDYAEIERRCKNAIQGELR